MPSANSKRKLRGATLRLTYQQALTLALVLRGVGGDPGRSRRADSDAMLKKIRRFDKLAYNMNEDSEKEGSIYFRDCVPVNGPKAGRK